MTAIDMPLLLIKAPYNESNSVRSFIRNILKQVALRRKSAEGTPCVGLVMEHLVRATLELYLGKELEQSKVFAGAALQYRSAFFQLGHVVIYVTNTPTHALIRKCKDNLDSGLVPLIVTSWKGRVSAYNLAEAEHIDDRIDVLEIEQFIATNIYEISRFKHDARKVTVVQLANRYNAIIESHETDPSIALQLG